MKAWAYRTYGLSIRSSFRLPELIPDTAVAADADVTIRLAHVPPDPRARSATGQRVRVMQSGVIFTNHRIGRIYIRNDHTVLVDPAADVAASALRYALYGGPFAAVLYRAGRLPLHASSVADGAGRAVLFLGRQGMGKSTLAALLTRRGYRLLSDDVSAVTCESPGPPLVAPGPARQKLCASTLHLLGEEENTWPLFDRVRKKYLVAAPGSLTTAPASVLALVFLEQGNAVRLSPLPGRDAIRHLLQHTYREPLGRALGRSASSLQIVRELVGAAPAWVLAAPRDRSCLPNVLDRLQGLWR